MNTRPHVIKETSALVPPFVQKPLDVVETAFNLYGFLPDDGDQRWQFLARYDEIKRQTGFRPVNFANAWNAIYLSEEPSRRSGYVSSVNPENCLQLDRALDNLDYIVDLSARYSTSEDGLGEVDMRYVLTDRISSDPTAPKQVVTPCPEALHQIRLYGDDGYLARVGFNVHEEEGLPVVSIVNIQGTPGATERNVAFKTDHGVAPFNALVQRVISLAEVEEPVLEVRGLINPERGNAQLYYGVLAQEGIQTYHAQRKVT